MKKFLAIILGVLFVMSFAASAFAIHAEIPSETQAVVASGATQVTLGGEVRVRGWYRDNIVSGNPNSGNSQAFYDQRVRLSVDAKIAPNVQGYLQLESNAGQTDTWIWGNLGQKPTDLHILQSWILHTGSGLFGFPAGLKIGHMPLALGHMEFFDHTRFGDDAIVFFMDPTKQMHIGLITVKFAGDGNALSLPQLGSLDPKGAAFGSRFDNTDDLDGYVGLITYKLDANNTIGVNYTYLNQSDLDFSHQNLGVHAGGKLAGFGYKAAADIQFGEAGSNEFGGYAFLAGLSYAMDPLTLRASFAYGSGDDDNDSDIDTFVNYVDAVQHYTLIYEYLVNSAAGRTASGISNTTYYNLGVDFKPMKDLSASIDGYYLRATEAPNSKDAGWEVDGKVVYQVAKNLKYQIDAGYFKAGDFYPEHGMGDDKGVTVVRNMLTLSF